jgi:hypothetical protein
MSSLAIDTLRYVKRLKAVGFTEEQAEVQAEALTEAVRESRVTKDDIRLAGSDLRSEMQALEARLDARFADLRVEIRDSHSSLLKWLIPLIIGQTAVVAALVKLF